TGIPGRGGRGAATPPAGRGGTGEPDLYEQDILRDVIPLVDAKYRTIAERRSRAIFGFSMGGGQSGRIGLRHLNMFSYIGIMSAGMGGGPQTEPLASLAADVPGTNAKIDLLWIGCGREDFAFAGASALSQ